MAAYFHWDDLQSLEQALWVAEKNEFDLESVKNWAEHEKERKKFEVFLTRLKQRAWIFVVEIFDFKLK